MGNPEWNNPDGRPDYAGDEFMEEGYRFWFSDTGGNRSPFPEKIRDRLRTQSGRAFLDWVKGLDSTRKPAAGDKDIREMFEIILFNEGMKLARNDDEKLTMTYPFMPRTGDVVNDFRMGRSRVHARTVVKRKKKSYLVLTLRTLNDSAEWESEFEIPS